MTRKAAKAHGPILDAVPGLRQRQRADGTWRLWWEPTAAQRALGATAVTFDATAYGHAAAQAARLNKRFAGTVPGDRPAQPSSRSVTDLIADYQTSLAWRNLRATTQRAYADNLKVIAAKWGPQLVIGFDRPVVATWYEALHSAKGVHRAQAIFRMLSILMTHAELRGWRPENSNPCLKVKVAVPEGRARVASWAEIDALLWAARSLRLRHMRMAILLAAFGGQRVTDIREAKPQQFRKLALPGAARPLWIWSLTQSKRGRVVEVPLHALVVPALRAQLALAATGPGTLIWDAATGKPFTKERLFRQWAQTRALAASRVPSIATLQERDLRRTFSNLARAGGATSDDVADVLGNTADTDPTLRQVYMAPQLTTALRAVAAIARPAPEVEPELKKRKLG